MKMNQQEEGVTIFFYHQHHNTYITFTKKIYENNSGETK